MLRKILTLIDGKKTNEYIWEVFLFSKRTFSVSENINVPTDKILTMNSPSIDGELFVDGEVYIL